MAPPTCVLCAARLASSAVFCAASASSWRICKCCMATTLPGIQLVEVTWGDPGARQVTQMRCVLLPDVMLPSVTPSERHSTVVHVQQHQVITLRRT